MNFLSKLLLPKVAGPIGAVILALIAYLSITGYTKSQRIESLSAQLEACVDEKQLIMDAATTYRTDNLQKDETIRKQSASIKELKARADAQRAAYEQRIQTARATSVSLQERAEALLATPVPVGDELTLCRAARDLLEKELTHD